MMKKPSKPSPCPKTISEYVSIWRKRWNTHLEYPCMVCQGTCKIYDPEDPRCPVEGNKCRRQIKCPVCEGAGNSTRDKYSGALKEAKLAHKKLMDEYKREMAIYRRLVDKLNSDEIAYLRKYGV